MYLPRTGLRPYGPRWESVPSPRCPPAGSGSTWATPPRLRPRPRPRQGSAHAHRDAPPPRGKEAGLPGRVRSGLGCGPLPWRGRAARGTARTGEVRWPPPPPPAPPRLVAGRKMADLEEQLSDEEKVRAARAAEPVGPGASRARPVSPESGLRGRAWLCPRCPPSRSLRPVPAPVSHPRPGGRSPPACSPSSL